MKSEVAEVVRGHFELDDAFDVDFYDRSGRQKKTMSMHRRQKTATKSVLKRTVSYSTQQGRRVEFMKALGQYVSESDLPISAQKRNVLAMMDVLNSNE